MFVLKQPTDLLLETHDLFVVRSDPDLLVSLAESMARENQTSTNSQRNMEAILARATETTDASKHVSRQPIKTQILLRIVATTNYFTDDAILMRNVPPTAIEIILDPWVGGLVPATVVPILVYVLAVAGVAVILAQTVVWILEPLANAGETQDKKHT